MPIRSAHRGNLAARCFAAALFAVFLWTGGLSGVSAQESAPAPAPAQNGAKAPARAPAAPAPAIPPAEDAARLAESIEPLKLTIDQIDAALQRDDLSDAVLAQHRGGLDPVRGQLREIVDTLEKRLADVDNRLKQLGDAPAADAPSEDAGLTAERTRLNERRAALDGTVKQTRLLILRAEDLSQRITERRRALFTQRLLGRHASALDPAFWAEAGRVAPETLRGVVMLTQSWMGYARSAASPLKIATALLTLLVFAGLAFAAIGWLERRTISHRHFERRFDRASVALTRMLRIAVTAPAMVGIAVLIIDAFGLMPSRILNIGFGLTIAAGIAAFGRGVAIGLFAPDEEERRLLTLSDTTARMAASHFVWAARVLAAVVFLNILQRAMVAPLSLTIATTAVFAAIIAGILCLFLYRVARADGPDDEVNGYGWLRAAGWLLAIGILASLATGFIGLAGFLAGRFLVALGVLGALYLVLVFTDTLFSDVLNGSNARGRSLAAFFGLKPRSLDLFGTLLSAALRLILIIVVLLPLLGPWGIFSADFASMLRDFTFGMRIGEITISLSAIVWAFAFIVVGILLTRAAQRWLTSQFLPRTTMDPSLQNSVATVFGYIGYIAAISLALAQLGVDFQRITLVAGALSIGIGFGLQSIVSNFVSGLILLAERPIRVGDVVSVKGEEGRVRRIHVRATEIETWDRASVIVPNSELITQMVKNRTHTDTFARGMITIGVSYDSDVARAREILLEIATEHPLVMQTPGPFCFVTGFGDSAVNLDLGWVVRNIIDGGRTKSEICLAILARFKAEGIDIPYPHRTIQIDGLKEADLDEAPLPAPKKPKGK